MGYWKFLDYITEENSNPISNWYGSVGTDVRAAFDVFVQEMSGIEDWDALKKKKHKELQREHAGMCELKFKVGSRKFRPLGILRCDLKEFIFLGGCEHRRMGSIPPDAFNDAFKLIEHLRQGRGGTREHF